MLRVAVRAARKGKRIDGAEARAGLALRAPPSSRAGYTAGGGPAGPGELDRATRALARDGAGAGRDAGDGLRVNATPGKPRVEAQRLDQLGRAHARRDAGRAAGAGGVSLRPPAAHASLSPRPWPRCLGSCFPPKNFASHELRSPRSRNGVGRSGKARRRPRRPILARASRLTRRRAIPAAAAGTGTATRWTARLPSRRAKRVPRQCAM